MRGVPVKTAMSPLECATWSAEFVRVRATYADIEGLSSRVAVNAAIEAADQAVIDLRDAFGTEHSSLALRELREPGSVRGMAGDRCRQADASVTTDERSAV